MSSQIQKDRLRKIYLTEIYDSTYLDENMKFLVQKFIEYLELLPEKSNMIEVGWTGFHEINEVYNDFIKKMNLDITLEEFEKLLNQLSEFAKKCGYPFIQILLKLF